MVLTRVVPGWLVGKNPSTLVGARGGALKCAHVRPASGALILITAFCQPRGALRPPAGRRAERGIKPQFGALLQKGADINAARADG